jgi:beta-phosphoglucomutase-like phosphatase (HAD superfamily)
MSLDSLYAAQRLAAGPDRCLVIEDSPASIDAALAAGMTAIGFSGGSHRGPEHHRGRQFMHIVNDRRYSVRFLACLAAARQTGLEHGSYPDCRAT